MKNKKYHTVVTFPKYNSKIVDRTKIDTQTQKYMTTQVASLVQALQ